jgi:hypothetical protein
MNLAPMTCSHSNKQSINASDEVYAAYFESQVLEVKLGGDTSYGR